MSAAADMDAPQDAPSTLGGGGLASLIALVRTRALLLGSASVLSVVATIFGLGPIVAVYFIADHILGGGAEQDVIMLWVGVAALASVLKHVLLSLSSVAAHVAAFGILYDLRVKLARKMARVPLGFFSRRDVGGLHKAMSKDVEGLEAFIAHMLPDAVSAFTVPVASFIIMLAVDWRLALASVAVVPIAVAFQMSMLGEDMQELINEHHDATEENKAAIHEFLRGLHVIKAFGLEASSFGKLTSAVQHMIDFVTGYTESSAKSFVVAMKLVSGGTNALFLVPIGLWLHSRGTLDPAVFVFFLLISTQVLSPFLRIATALGNLQMLLRGSDNIHAILAEPELEPGTAAPPETHDIAFEGVTFGYEPGRDVLHEVSVTARSGELTAIVGASGSGKTTLVRLIARFWDVDSGAVRVGGVDVRELDLDAWMERVALVFQDVFLFHGTVRENLRLAREHATDDEFVAACEAARIHEVIEGLPEGYDTVLGDRGARLSGGEKQRLSLARAFLKDAPVLLLDEATAFADPQSEALIQQALRELSVGRTVIVIAHKLSTIRNADQIVVLDEGALVASGTHDELVEGSTHYRTLWDAYRSSIGWTMGEEGARV